MFKFYDTHIKPALKQPIEDLPNSSEIRKKKTEKEEEEKGVRGDGKKGRSHNGHKYKIYKMEETNCI